MKLLLKLQTCCRDEATLYHEDESVQLSFTELQILNMLFRNEGKYVSRTALIEKCWESENFIDDNTLASI